MEPPYSIADFHHVLRKQLASSAAFALAEAKMQPNEFDAILYSARALCRDDLAQAGRLALHGLEADGASLNEADEAYLSIAAGDPEGDGEWLSLSYWLSDLALADRDPARVRAVVAAIERSLVKVNAWLAEQERGPDEPAAAEPASKLRAKRAPKPKLTKAAESPDS